MSDLRDSQFARDMRALPRDKAAEQGQRQTFAFAGYRPAFVAIIAGIWQGGEAIGLALQDADGVLYRFRLPRSSAVGLIPYLTDYRDGLAYTAAPEPIESNAGLTAAAPGQTQSYAVNTALQAELLRLVDAYGFDAVRTTISEDKEPVRLSAARRAEALYDRRIEQLKRDREEALNAPTGDREAP